VVETNATIRSDLNAFLIFLSFCFRSYYIMR
jgi:hypothetical protein